MLYSGYVALTHGHPARRLHAPTGRSILTVLLVLRGAANAVFAFWLFTRHPGWSEFFETASVYAIVDGGLGLCAGLLLTVHVLDEAPSLLAATTIADGLLRVAAGVVLRVLPGVADFPVTAVSFCIALSASAGLLAMVAVFMRLTAPRRARAMGVPPARLHELFDPLDIAGLVGFALAAYAFVFGPPVTADELRLIGMAWGATFALAFFVSALGVAPRR